MAKTDKRTAKAEFSVKLEVLKQLKTKTGLYIPNADKEVKMGGQHGDGIGIIFSKIKPQPEGANGTAANPYHYSIAATDNAPDWARAAIKGAKPGIRNSFKPALRCALANTLLPSGFTVRAAADGKYQLRENGKTLSVHKQISGAIESAFQAADEINSSPQSKMDAKDKKLRKIDSDRAPVVDTDFRPIDTSKMSPRNFTAGFARNFSMDNTQKAEEMHQEIACDLCNALRERKLRPLCTQSIDVAAYEGKLVFEIKSANEKNFENQARGGIIQILEYKWQCESQKKISPQPVLVIASISSAKREAYMKKFAESVGVSVVWYHCGRPLPERFDGLDELLD